MRSNANSAPIKTGKRRLLGSCAVAAGMAALACGGPALAQVAGTGQVVTGPGLSTPTISPPGPGATNVDTTGAQTIINWTPTDTLPTGGAIDFLPTGNTLNFSGSGDYTVLNRFVDGGGGALSRQIAINGTVNAIDTSGSGTRGGNIWFYNAGGILIGPTGVINVGSLVLTSNNIITTGGLFGPTGQIRFAGAPGSTSSVVVNGEINANKDLNPGSAYVALIAPRVVQAGAVTVDGSAAYVAAEQVNIATNNGLFDISILVGAESGEVITHTGTTMGPADVQADPDRSRIYMVAVAKNDAVSMLVSGQIGYDDAAVAQAQPDGAVILSAGYNIAAGEIAGPANDLESNITVADVIFRSDTTARARGAFLGRSALTLFSSAPPNEGNVFVEGNGLFIGDQSASLDIQLDQAGGASGNLTLQSRGPGGAEVNVNTGELNVGGNLVIDGIATFDPNSGISTAGLARLQVGGGGDVTVTGNVAVTANAEGGFDDVGNSGIGYGGNVSIEVGGGGSTLTAGNIDISANGTGGGVIFDPINGPFVEDVGADGVGGVATISVQNGGSITATNSITATANGQGQTGLLSSGNGIGGTASIDVVGESTSLQAPIVTASANGSGGGTFSSPPPFGTTFSAAGGSGIGGTASMTFNVDTAGGGNIGAASISATGTGGNAGNSESASAGGATGGNASLTIANGTVSIGDLTVDAAAIGGSSTSPSGTTATSGDAFGGNASVLATETGDLEVTGTIAINVGGSAGASENIGSARGGGANVNANAGGSIAVTGEILIDAGGSNRHNLVAQNAGTATGGNVSLGADGGSIVADSYFVNASAMVVNVAGDSGTAQGGTIAIDARGTGLIGVSSSGTGSRFDAGASSGISADGTDALGGIINVTVNAGTLNLGTLGAVTSFNASGISGGATIAGGPVPVGAGGNIQFRVEADGLDSSVLSFDGLNISADGRTAVDIESAPSLPRDTAGTGSGGITLFDIAGGTVTGGVINLSSDGYGGGTGNDSATGQGGTTILTQTGGTVNVADVRVSADGFGGTALGTSGTGFGGTATINLFGGSITAADIIASASGEGGVGSIGNDDDPLNIIAGGNGGQGIGANASIFVDGAVTINASTIGAFANGQGGAGGDFQNASSATGDPGAPGFGGTGQGGNASVTVFNGDVTTSDLTADSSGFGGAGGASFYIAGPMTGVGVGGSGGLGQGGLSMVDLIVPISAAGTVASVSQGTGGLGGTHNVGGTGGDGFGGIAQAIVTNADGGTLAVTLDTRAQGGNGGQGLDGNGGNGGYGFGGIARVAAEGPEASLTVVETNFLTTGTGGNGGNAGLAIGAQPMFGPGGGFGGNGQGGTIEIAANAGGTVRLGFTSGNAVTLSSTGIGGNGGAGASNFGSTTLPGDDGILGTADDVVVGHIGGDGGVAGAGIGGDVRLIANGGTITSNGENLTISVSGTSGNGGEAGNGTGGTGSCCSISADVGGRVSLEAWADADGAGSIELGNTNISANGLFAGRISIVTDGSITMAGLNAQALGFAAPTNNDTDEAGAGIFLGATGGTIRSNGAMTLSTDSSIGVYAQGNGRVDVDGDMIIEAGDQIDLRHEFRGNNVEGPTITAANNLSLLAGTSISGAPGTRLAATENLNLINTSPNGSIGVDRLDAAGDIAITSNGFVSVEHAEAVGNFVATVGSFRTGLNSIITGGDININAAGSVDLGNSNAGGFVQVISESLVFNSLVAGDTVNLITNGTLAGAEGIRGVNIDAGDDITLNGNSIALTGNVTGSDSFFAFGSGGPVSVNNADVGGSISIFSGGDLSGTYVAGGDVFLNSGANIAASAQASGGYIDRNGNMTQGNLFAIATGNAALTDSSAGRMFGVNAGAAASINGGTAGEDVLVIAGTTATLIDVTGGDDITVRAAGNINAVNVRTTGAGADTHILDFSTSGSPTFTIGTGEGSDGINGADIVMASTAGAIDAATLSGGDDILLNAANSIALNGATTLGLGTTGGDSSIRTQGGATTLANLASFDDIIVGSTATANFATPSTAGRNVIVNADAVTLAPLTEPNGSPINTLEAAGDITINAVNAIAGGSLIGDGVTLTAGTAIDVDDVNGGTVALDGATGVTAARIFAVNTTDITSADGNIQIGSLSSNGQITASANAIRIDNGGNMIFTSLVTDVGDAVVNGGEVFVIDGNVAGKAELTSTGERLGIDTLTAGSAELEASGGFMTLNNVTVTGSLDASAQGAMLISGIVTGQNIALASSDIAIDSAARVGTAGATATLSVRNNNSDNPTFVGGTGTPDGYHIDAAELTRLYGTQIEIFAPAVQAAGSLSVGSAAPPDVIVDSFTMTGGAAGSNLGANGALTIRTPGKMRVIGNVQLTGLTDANALNLFADDALEVILGQGSVRLLGANNAPGGQLNMASDDIIVATQAAITAVGAATTIDAINSRLGENDGVVLDEGALFARGIRAEVAGGFYVQNSGAGTDFGQRRGLTFGAGGLDIATTGPSRIAINGVQIGANGQVTGIDVIPILTINGARPAVGSYDRRSTFNGCFIASPAACTTITFDFENNFPVQDVIEEEVKGDDDGKGDGNNLPQPLITMRDLDPLTGEPLLDDPVTGSGNDDLWTPPAQ